MKKSELKKIIKESILNEMSNLNSIGISPEQIKTLHTQLDLAHDSAPTPIQNKTELKKALTDNRSDNNVLFGLDKESNLYVAILEFPGYYEKGNKPYVNVYKVATDGSISQEWKRQSFTKGLAKMTQISKYYTASSRKRYKPSMHTPDDELDNTKHEIHSNTIKMIQDEFEAVKQEVKQQIVKHIENNDFYEARALINRVSEPSQFSSIIADKPVTLKYLLGGYWSSRDNFENKIFRELEKRKSAGTMRQRAAELARKYGNELRSSLLGKITKYER